ncbi:MAG: alpha/beta hydrolase, partial [Acidimicrobiales bacterium]
MEIARSADGTRIAIDRFGQGPPLVLVVGAFWDRSTPRALAAKLAPEFTVFSYDRRGRGDSGDTALYAVDREIEDLRAVIGVAGGSAFVYGHSSGAVLALEATARGLPVTKLAVYEPPYIIEGTRARPATLATRVSELLASGRRSEAAELFLIEGPGLPPEVLATMKAGPTWSRFEAIAHTLPYDLAITGDQGVPVADLAKITVPVLVLGGANSP